MRDRKIIDILDGDTKFGNQEYGNYSVQIAMPHLSGPKLCAISTQFGLPVVYEWGGTNLSRWQYLDKLLEYCIKKNKCSDLLKYLFSKEKFLSELSEYPPEVIESAYNNIMTEIIKQINIQLYFGGNELAIIGNRFVIKAIDSNVEVETPKLRSIDREYIKDISSRSMQDIENRDYDSAINKSRTLLEEVFCYVIEKKKETPSTSGKISDLYKQVKDLYNMHADSNIDKRINTLLSGLEKIVSAISEMRNKVSDAHGIGAKRINIDEHHARLLVNSAMIMADFILSVEKNLNRHHKNKI